jgi:hypothetical protein
MMSENEVQSAGPEGSNPINHDHFWIGLIWGLLLTATKVTVGLGVAGIFGVIG